ncbi:MAG: permease [Candidatus Omnitrophica bacterium]|nr:permease [Candidatus Omnitrophota bacterium]
MREFRKFLLMLAVFLGCFYMPVEALWFRNPLFEALALVRWYAREHVLLCLVPVFFIAGAIATFISQASVIRYFGAKANKFLAYSVASVSGTILAVCSCTVLPLFAGIYKRGAGLGPATVFLYSGPAINVMAIIMTARVLGWELGLARAIGAVLFSIAIGFLMHVIFIKEELASNKEEIFAPPEAGSSRSLKEWFASSWSFAKQIMPLLLIGVFVAGILLGRPGQEGLIPSWIISRAVGGNSFLANFFASIVGAVMYFATLTEVPILQGLIGNGMGKGPALALLLAGPALSLPNMLVIRSIMGTKKTIVFVALVVVMASVSGVLFGALVK